MKRDVHRAGQLNQFTSPGLVDVAVGGQATDHNAIRLGFLAQADVLANDLHFITLIKEISSTWPDQHLQTDAQMLPGKVNAAEAGRGAPFQKVIAELDPVRAAAFGSNRTRH